MMKTPFEKIVKWLKKHPDKCLAIAVEACVGLWLDEHGQPLWDDDSFKSGADFIEDMVEVQAAVGFMKLIDKLREEQ